MLGKRFLAFTALIGLAATPVLAQSTAPFSPSHPAVTAPAMPVASSPTMTMPVTKRTNLNTATAAELDVLPEVGSARSKVILDERGKAKFKDWADFDRRMAGTSVNAGVKAKIKDLVVF
jgi:competence protein ComEA